MSNGWRIGVALAAVGALAAGGLVAGAWYFGSDEGLSGEGTATGTSTTTPGTWLSGASSDQAADGEYGTWRNTPVQIGGTWDDGDDGQVNMYTICAKGPWASWDKPLDVAVGAIELKSGETWAAAAAGAYDERWTKNLNKIKECWGERNAANLYIRFAHEANLDTSHWKVLGGQEADFVTAITRYSTLRYQILPEANVVLCPNDTTSPGLNHLDIRKLWPGKDPQGRPVANIYAVDSYNMSPHVTSKRDFTKKITGLNSDGSPRGIETHRLFAQEKGVPFAISEWSNHGDPKNSGGGGESPLYVKEFYAWAHSHSGDPTNAQPGQLLYEIHFNLWTQFSFWPKTIQPETAEAYRSLPWGR